MMWKLWLDDQLNDPETPMRHTPEGHEGARTTQEAVDLLKRNGLPAFMNLDHDLGGEDTAMKFLYRMRAMFPNGPVPEHKIHSQNPVAIQSMIAYLDTWKKVLGMSGPAIDTNVKVVTFGLDAEQMERVETFREIHRTLHGSYAGAIGGRYTFEFTPTSLGTVQRCSCTCGDYIDVSRYDDW